MNYCVGDYVNCFFIGTATTDTYTISLHEYLPIWGVVGEMKMVRESDGK